MTDALNHAEKENKRDDVGRKRGETAGEENHSRASHGHLLAAIFIDEMTDERSADVTSAVTDGPRPRDAAFVDFEMIGERR